MKGTVARVLLAVLALTGEVFAEWVKYAESVETDFYFNPKAVRTVPGQVHVWVLFDNALKDPGDHRPRSQKIYFAIDCKQARGKPMIVHNFADPMGAGELLDSYGQGSWTEPLPNSPFARLVGLACEGGKTVAPGQVPPVAELPSTWPKALKSSSTQ